MMRYNVRRIFSIISYNKTIPQRHKGYVIMPCTTGSCTFLRAEYGLTIRLTGEQHNNTILIILYFGLRFGNNNRAEDNMQNIIFSKKADRRII